MDSEDQICSRLIVKNLPKHLDEKRFKEHFENLQKKDKSIEELLIVTDTKICRKGNKSRQFGFIGFSSEKHAQKALKFFNGSYIDTSKIEVSYAKKQGDDAIPRAWSRYTPGTSAYKMTNKNEQQDKNHDKDQNQNANSKDVLDKKERFRQFLQLMGVNSQSQKEKKDEKVIGVKSSWNDHFQTFMTTQNGQGANLNMDYQIDNVQPKKEENQEKKSDVKGENEDKKEPKQNTEVQENKRLYIMNLPFTVQDGDLQTLFGKFGDIEKIEIPLRKGGKGQAMGIAFINFNEIEGAITAFANLDQEYYQGRKLHIMPAQEKPPQEETVREFKNEDDGEKDDFKKDKDDFKKDKDDFKKDKDDFKKKKDNDGPSSEFKSAKVHILKTNFDDETNWNYLYLNQDTVAKSMAKKLGIDQNQMLDRFDSNIAVKKAFAETLVINQTKEWLQDNGIEIDKLEKLKREKCKRSKKIILVKNIPYTTKEKDLREIFERYGELARLSVSPFNTIAIVEYEHSNQATSAMKYLAYYKINYINPIYLEFAPQVFKGMKDKNKAKANDADASSAEDDENKEGKNQDDEDKEKRMKTIFVKNLNFNTTEHQLEELFRNTNTKGKVLSAKIIRKSENQMSRGYGFVEMNTSEAALNGIKKLQNTILDDHALKLSLSQKGASIDDKENEAKKDKLLKKRKAQSEHEIADNEDLKSTKLLIRNLAFEATPNDVRELFNQFGSLKKVRLPKKVNSQSHRGFGFVEFSTPEEAMKAFKQLQHTHLYGRKIVIEWSQLDSADDQVNKKTKKKQKSD